MASAGPALWANVGSGVPVTGRARPSPAPAAAAPWPAPPAPTSRRPGRPGWRPGRDGFYEWKKLDGRKQPYYIQLQDGQFFTFAGPWERWNRGDEPIDSGTILTTDANELVGSIHDRMPVILNPGDYGLWLAQPAVVRTWYATGEHRAGSGWGQTPSAFGSTT